MVLVHPVQRLCLSGLFLKAKRFGNRCLHLECQFIRLDACAEVFVAGVVNPADAVEATKQTKVFLLLIGGHRVRGSEIRQWLFRVGREADTCVFRPKVASAMCPRTAAAVACRSSQNDKLREVFIQRPKAVGGPAPDGWVGAFAYMPAGLKCQLRAVVVINRPEAADNGEVIRAGPDFLEPITHFKPAFPVALIARLQRHDNLAVSMIWVPRLDFRADFFRVKDIRVRGFIDGLAGVLVELWFDIKALEVRDASAEKDPDDGFCFGLCSRATAIDLALPRLRWRREPALCQHRAKGKAGKSHPCVSQKRTPGNSLTGGGLMCRLWLHHGFIPVTLSNRYKFVMIDEHGDEVFKAS